MLTKLATVDALGSTVTFQHTVRYTSVNRNMEKHSFVRLFVRLLVHSLIHSFIYSFIHSFIIKSKQQTCTHDYNSAVENKHRRMNKNNKNNKNTKRNFKTQNTPAMPETRKMTRRESYEAADRISAGRSASRGSICGSIRYILVKLVTCVQTAAPRSVRCAADSRERGHSNGVMACKLLLITHRTESGAVYSWECT